MEQAYRSSLAGATGVCRVPARTGTQWWHAWVRGKAEVRERQGRMTFVGAPHSAGFDAVAVLYRPPLAFSPARPRVRWCAGSRTVAQRDGARGMREGCWRPCSQPCTRGTV